MIQLIISPEIELFREVMEKREETFKKKLKNLDGQIIINKLV